MIPAEEKTSYSQINLSQIIPDMPLPFSLFFFFKGKFVEVIKKGQSMSASFLAKSLMEENYFAYVSKDERKLWLDWCVKNRRVSFLDSFTQLEENKEATRRKVKYLQFSLQTIKGKSQRLEQQKIFNEAERVLRDSVNHSLMAPFFSHAFNEVIFKHSARVTYLMILFALTHPALLEIKNADFLIYASMIHELEGSPETSFNPNAYQGTLEFLERNQLVFPERVVELIQHHGDFFNERRDKMDTSLKIFSLINSFDHIYSMTNQGLGKKGRMDKTIEQMGNNLKNYDSTVFEYFCQYIPNIDYSI